MKCGKGGIKERVCFFFFKTFLWLLKLKRSTPIRGWLCLAYRREAHIELNIKKVHERKGTAVRAILSTFNPSCSQQKIIYKNIHFSLVPRFYIFIPFTTFFYIHSVVVKVMHSLVFWFFLFLVPFIHPHPYFRWNHLSFLICIKIETLNELWRWSWM